MLGGQVAQCHRTERCPRIRTGRRRRGEGTRQGQRVDDAHRNHSGRDPAKDMGESHPMKRLILESIRKVVLKVVPKPELDLSKLDKIPANLRWPLERHGFDPVPRMAATRAEESVHLLGSLLGMRIFLVLGQEAGRQVLVEPKQYSTDIRPYVGRSGRSDGDIGGLGFTDPPEHTRLRKLITPEFTMRRLQRIQPELDRIIAERLDALAAQVDEDGVVDLAEVFAFQVPFQMICELLGLDTEDRTGFREVSEARFDVSSGGAGALGAISESREFLKAATAKQRLEPGPGLIGQILREHGEEINDFDLAGLADGVFNGGMETSASMLAMGSAVLLSNPEAFRRMREQPDAVPGIVEELLRYLSVVQIAFPRFARSDHEVDGVAINRGDVLLVSMPGTNRDDSFGENPESFDPDRVVKSHMAFGHGIHRCVGSELARMELRAAFSALATRFPQMELVPDQDLGFRAESIVYGVERVLVRPYGSARAAAPRDDQAVVF